MRKRIKPTVDQLKRNPLSEKPVHRNLVTGILKIIGGILLPIFCAGGALLLCSVIGLPPVVAGGICVVALVGFFVFRHFDVISKQETGPMKDGAI